MNQIRRVRGGARLLQAVEYRDIGVRRVEGWIETARKGLIPDTAKASPTVRAILREAGISLQATKTSWG